jgi:hypothetical protein
MVADLSRKGAGVEVVINTGRVVGVVKEAEGVGGEDASCVTQAAERRMMRKRSGIKTNNFRMTRNHRDYGDNGFDLFIGIPDNPHSGLVGSIKGQTMQLL